MIRIKSKQKNFRRCGIPHDDRWVEYPDDRFTATEVSILQAEPMLVVDVIADEQTDSGAGAGEIDAVMGERPDDAEPGIQIGPKDLPDAADSGKQPGKAAKKGKR